MVQQQGDCGSENFQSYSSLISTKIIFDDGSDTKFYACVFFEIDNFQSYSSLISTIGFRNAPLCLSCSFNPTLVWFQHTWRIDKDLGENTFNPTLVWFQQQNASGAGVHYMVSFNPTLVWFQQENGWATEVSAYQPFNPTLVWFQLYNRNIAINEAVWLSILL